MSDATAREARPRRFRAIRSLCGAALVAIVGVAAAADDPSEKNLLFGKSYPLEVSVSFPAALFYWIDSLAGTSGGKTVPAHQREFVDHFGAPTRQDAQAIESFLKARAKHAGSRAPDRSSIVPVTPGSALLQIFCGSDSVDAAVEQARSQLDPDDLQGLRTALDHFGPRYEKIWRDGAIPRDFLERAKRDRARKPIARLLQGIVEFFDVDLSSAPRPHVVLVPVLEGYGTHAAAFGRHLLMEVRRGESLPDEASVIVHENSHFLFYLIGEDRERRLAESMIEAGADGRRAWDTLREALPTALGQGVADRKFRPRLWSMRSPWYHTEDVDSYAKALYPLVDRALQTGRRFDEGFLREALALYPR